MLTGQLLSCFNGSESRTIGQVSEDRWQRQDTGEGAWGQGDPSCMHHRGPSVRSGNWYAEMRHLQGRNTRTLEIQKWENHTEGQRTGEGRKTDDAGAGQSSGAWGWTDCGAVSASSAQTPSLGLSWPCLTAGSLGGWAGFFFFFFFFLNFLLVVCLLHLTWKQ